MTTAGELRKQIAEGRNDPRQSEQQPAGQSGKDPAPSPLVGQEEGALEEKEDGVEIPGEKRGGCRECKAYDVGRLSATASLRYWVEP